MSTSVPTEPRGDLAPLEVTRGSQYPPVPQCVTAERSKNSLKSQAGTRELNF